MKIGQKVFLEHGETDAEIYYTTDGSKPSIGNQSTEVRGTLEILIYET